MAAIDEGAGQPPQQIDPLRLLASHRITTSATAARHTCSCGESFDIDRDAEQPYLEFWQHMNLDLADVADSSRKLLQRIDARGIELPGELRCLLDNLARQR